MDEPVGNNHGVACRKRLYHAGVRMITAVEQQAGASVKFRKEVLEIVVFSLASAEKARGRGSHWNPAVVGRAEEVVLQPTVCTEAEIVVRRQVSDAIAVDKLAWDGAEVAVGTEA